MHVCECAFAVSANQMASWSKLMPTERLTSDEGEEEGETEDNDILPCDNQMYAFRINGY